MTNLNFDILWRDQGAARGLKDLGQQATNASAGFNKMKAGSEAAAIGQKRLQAAAESASRSVKTARAAEEDATRQVSIQELKLKELRETGKAKASQLAEAEDRLVKSKRGLRAAQDRTATATRGLTDAQDKATKSLAAADKSADRASLSFRNLGGRIKGAIPNREAFSGIAKKMRDLGGATDDSKTKMGKFGAAGGAVGGILKKVPVAAVALGVLGLGAAFKNSIDKAAGFDKTMRQVGIQTGQTGDQLKGMTALALQMGKVTSFSAQGASDAMLELAKGGLSAAQMKAGALEQTLTLATAGGLDLGAAASYMTQGLNTFGLKAEDAGRVAAALAGAANASTASVEDMGTALSQVGPAAKIAGLSIEDTTAALAAFTNNGMKGSDAGTSLKTMLTRLVPSTGKAREAMADLGLVTADGGNKFFDAQGNIKSMTEVSGLLQNALKDQTAKQKIATLATIFGSDAARAAAILAKEGAEGLAVYAKATGDSEAAQMLAKAATDGYSGALERFQGSVETAQIQLGTKFLPILTTVLDYLSGPGMDTLTSVGTIFQDTFSTQLNAASGGIKKFFDYLSTHQASVIETFKVWGNGVFDFGVAVAKMAAGGLRSMGDFTYGATRAVLSMVGSILKAFDGIPGVDLRDSIKNFEEMDAAANTAAWNARGDLYGLATGIDKKVVPSIEAMRNRFNKSANTQILTAKQRDAVARVTIAVGELGTKSDGTKLKIKKFADITNLGAGEQRAFRGRLQDARGALAEQLTAARKAGAGQKELTRTWKDGRAKLYAEFVQMGLSKKEAGRLADKYAGIKPKVSTKFETPGARAAKKAVGDVDKAIENTNGKSVDVGVKIKFNPNKLAASMIKGNYFDNPGAFQGGGSVRSMAGRPEIHGHHDAGADDMHGVHGGGAPGEAPMTARYSSNSPSAPFGSLINKTASAAGMAGRDYGEKIGEKWAAAAKKKFDASSGPSGNGGISPGGPGISGAIAAGRRLGFSSIGTYPGHHPTMARARDFMTSSKAQGDRLAAHLWANRQKYNIWYLIWWRRIISMTRPGAGWRPYFDGNSSNPNRAHTNHVHASVYDRGGMLRNGGSADNRSGSPERVLSPVQTRSFENLVRVLDRQGGTTQVHYHISAPNYVGSRDELRRTLVDMSRRGQLQVIQR